MPLYRDAAIVLRTHKLGEADRIITMLTRSHGKVRAVGKGVRRTRSRFGARLEPGMVIDVQCYIGRSLDTVTQVESLAPYGDQIARDYDSYTAGAAMLETAERLCDEAEPSQAQFVLLAGALAALAGREHEPGLVLDSYLLRAMAVGGWAASFHDCARCGAPGPHRAFHLASGGVLCPDCRVGGSTAPHPDTLVLLGALQEGDWAQAEEVDPARHREASGLVAAHLQWHLERGVRSLKHVERA